MMREAQPINDAFYRVDIGEGTQADFDVIRKFVADIQNETATNTQVANNPLKVAETLPKAGALNGGVPTPNKVDVGLTLLMYRHLLIRDRIFCVSFKANEIVILLHVFIHQAF